MPICPANSWTTSRFSNLASGKSNEDLSEHPVLSELLPWFDGTHAFWDLDFEKHLGAGAQFQVDLYRNPHIDSGKPDLVAVKTARITTRDILDNVLEDGPTRISRHDDVRGKKTDLYNSIRREIQILSHPPLQSHPNIMRLLGTSWTTDTSGTSRPQLIVEYSSIGSLFAMLASSPPLKTQEKLDIIFDIASGLERVHQCGIVHGDMKLSNIMMFPSEHPACRFTAKISDFGSSIEADDLDHRKTYWGSPGYQPPDPSTKSPMSMADLQSCDVFALGLCTWEILNNGRRFFEDGQDSEQLRPDRHAISTSRHPDLTRIDAFLDSISLTLKRGLSINGLQLDDTAPALTELSAREPVKLLLHGLLAPDKSLRWSCTQIVRHMFDSQLGPSHKPAMLDVETTTTPFTSRRSLYDTFISESLRDQIPRNAQSQHVEELQKLCGKQTGAERINTLLRLSEYSARGFGTAVDFQKCLQHLLLAAEDWDSGAVDAVLVPISAAILGEEEEDLLTSTYIDRAIVGEKEDDLLTSTYIDRAIRPELLTFEKDLCRHTPHERCYRRWLRWGQIWSRTAAESLITVQDADGSLHVLGASDEESRDNFILETIKDPVRAIARYKGPNSQDDGMPLLQFAAAMDWHNLLQLLHAQDPRMLHHCYDDYSREANVCCWGSLLHSALAYGRAGMVRFLVEKVGVPVGTTGCLSPPHRYNPLNLSFNLHDDELEDTIDCLIDHGADVNGTKGQSYKFHTLPGRHFPLDMSGPPLAVAIRVGRLRLVKILLERGADPLLQVPGQAGPLQLAVALHVHEIVDVILSHIFRATGATDVDIRARTGNIMVHLAGTNLGGRSLFTKWLLHGSHYKEACQETIAVCLKHGFDINAVREHEDTPLLLAADQNPCHDYVLEALLDKGADPNIPTKSGDHALAICCRRGWDTDDCSRRVKALVAKRANARFVDSRGCQPIHDYAAKNMKGAVELLLEEGVDIELKGQFDHTPLTMAVFNDAYDCAEFLLDKGANVDAWVRTPPGSMTTTSLGNAARNAKVRLFQLLMKRGANPFPQPHFQALEGQTITSALHTAAKYGSVEIIRVALREFPETYRTPEFLSRLDGDGVSILDYAARGHLRCVKELLLAGAPLEARTQNWDKAHSPLGASVQAREFSISSFLLQKGASPWVRGQPGERHWSFLCDAVHYIGIGVLIPQRNTISALLDETWQWVQEYDLLRTRDHAGRTILHMAIYFGLVDVARVLVERGASVYDCVGKPIRTVSRTDPDFSGMHSLDYARMLSNLTPKRRVALYYNDSVNLPDEGIRAVVRFLEEFDSWPKTAIDEELRWNNEMDKGIYEELTRREVLAEHRLRLRRQAKLKSLMTETDNALPSVEEIPEDTAP